MVPVPSRPFLLLGAINSYPGVVAGVDTGQATHGLRAVPQRC